MPRLFAAIPLPLEIAEYLARFKQPLPGARWLEPSAYHIALRFAGDITGPVGREFADSLARIDMDAFPLRLQGSGVFGGNEPSALWAGVEPSTELENLQRACERAAKAAGLGPERRQFKPHVTIARFRYPRVEPIARFLERSATAKSPTFLVDRFCLMSAKPGTGGGPYGIEETFPLHGYVDTDDYDETEFSGKDWHST